jgi:hypothetical protein
MQSAAVLASRPENTRRGGCFPLRFAAFSCEVARFLGAVAAATALLALSLVKSWYAVGKSGDESPHSKSGLCPHRESARHRNEQQKRIGG